MRGPCRNFRLSRRHALAGVAASMFAPLSGCFIFEDPPRVIGFLDRHAANTAIGANNLDALRRGLGEQGFADGDTITIECRYADGEAEQFSSLAKELIDLNVAVLAVGTMGAARAAMALNPPMPVVFAQATDAAAGLVEAAIAGADKNLTGIANVSDLDPKRLRLLHPLVPSAARIAYVSDPNIGSYERDLAQTREEAARLGRELLALPVGNDTGMATAYSKLSGSGVGGLIASSMRGLRGHPERVISLAARRKLPAIYFDRVFTDAGGLMSYGPSFTEVYRLAGVYVGRILNGERPGNLPILDPHATELVVNQNTARALGLTIPAAVLAEANQVLG